MPKKMFSFIDGIWNPITGQCPYSCSYCWAKRLAKRYNMEKYKGKPKLDIRKTNFEKHKFVFVGDMRDLFSEDIPLAYLIKILEIIAQNKNTMFLFLSKNPRRYLELIKQVSDVPKNIVWGATIETDSLSIYDGISRAPDPFDRYEAMTHLKWHLPKAKLFISVEPILDFSMWRFTQWLVQLAPWKIAIGYDNYGHKLREPPRSKTQSLIEYLGIKGISLEIKTIRDAWYEQEGKL